MKYQDYYFKQSLIEKNINPDFTTFHYEGKCYNKITGFRPMTFPMSLVEKIEVLDKTKTQDFYFSGVITNKRKWITKFNCIKESYYGRKPEKKFIFDIEYYKGLCSSHFAPSPTGDCPWSYRFFEAIMCKCIPILSVDEIDIFSDNFFYYRDGEELVYDEKIVEQNYKVFLEKHTLLKLR